MLHNEARKLVLEAWDKTHNAREIAKYFSVNESTVYRLIEERARTGSYETSTQLRGRKTIPALSVYSMPILGLFYTIKTWTSSAILPASPKF